MTMGQAHVKGDEKDSSISQEVAEAKPTPLIDKNELIQKLQEVPEELLRSILTNQVDLEIRLKHKELRLTEEELGKCEAQMLALRKFFEVPNEVSFQNEPSDFTVKYYNILNKSLSVNYTKLQQQHYAQEHPVFKENIFAEGEAIPHSYRTRSTTSSLRPSVGGPALRVSGCLYRRTDGIIVKLTCPDCQRSNFSSAQGFLNHSRIAHSKEYTSQDAAALSCGEVLPDDLQDEEGLASLKSLRRRSINSSKNLNVSELYFDGLSRSLNTVHKGSQPETSTELAGPGASNDSPKVFVDEKGHEQRLMMKEPKVEESESQELMKKLIKSGVSTDANDYKEMVEEFTRTVPNSHLFGDEEEIEDPENETKAEENITAKAKEVAAQGKRSKTLARSTATVTESSKVSQLADAGTSRSETGGKYENRLRRRKSRTDFSAEPVDMEADSKNSNTDDRRSKRRRSQR